jgi:hypothetical protein
MWGVNREDLVKGPFRQASPDGASGRRAREFETIAAMLRIYCRAHHRSKGAGLCPECAALRDYAHQRLERCRFGEDKPTCVQCPVHCYKADMRERVRQVMRWAGPRMLWRHPLLALRHLVDARRTPPVVGRPR